MTCCCVALGLTRAFNAILGAWPARSCGAGAVLQVFLRNVHIFKKRLWLWGFWGYNYTKKHPRATRFWERRDQKRSREPLPYRNMPRSPRRSTRIVKRDLTPLQDPTRRACTGGGERAGPDEVPDEKTLDPMDGDDCVVGPNDPRVEPDQVQRDESIFGDWYFSAAAIQVDLAEVLNISIKQKMNAAYLRCCHKLQGHPRAPSMLMDLSVSSFQNQKISPTEVDKIKHYVEALVHAMTKLKADRLSDQPFTEASRDLIGPAIISSTNLNPCWRANIHRIAPPTS